MKKFILLFFLVFFMSISVQAATYTPTQQEWLEVAIAKYLSGFNDFDTSVVVFEDFSISVGIYYISDNEEDEVIKFKQRIQDQMPGIINKYDWAKDAKVLVNIYKGNYKIQKEK